MSQRTIFRFWLPLFASWLLLTAEGPIITAVLNRLPNEIIMVGAQGIVLSLSVTLESPIINLLATSTAKVHDRASFLLVRRFTVHWMIVLTVLSVALAFTPLFELVIERGMGIAPETARWVRLGLRITIFWSAAIAWRRFLQGVLIRFGRTEAMAQGTAVRLISGALTAVGLATLTDAPGVVVGATTLIVAVVVEALFATWAVRPILAGPLAPGSAAADTALTYRALLAFHLPLANTSVLTLLVQPLVLFSLARLALADLSLAAWPILFQIMLMARAPALASPEAIIALNRGDSAEKALQRFITTLTVASLLLMVILVLTPLDRFYLLTLQDTELPVADLVSHGLHLLLLLPALTMANFGLRGLLISHGRTRPINTGMLINVVVTTVVLLVGVAAYWPGIATAAMALNSAVIVETLYLAWTMKRRRPQPSSLPTRP